MDLPSMVQRSGNTLIVRSVVSGNLLYMDYNNGSGRQQHVPYNYSSTNGVEQELKRSRIIAQLQQQQQQQPQHNFIQQLNTQELKDEDLPQCKIKRNYSCSCCNYSTTNPRHHLTHLRDMHGEKIVINKCRLCLYASRHFQKLVRHMKMVHGCTEKIPGQHGTMRKRALVNRGRQRRQQQQQSQGDLTLFEQQERQEEVEKNVQDSHNTLETDVSTNLSS